MAKVLVLLDIVRSFYRATNGPSPLGHRSSSDEIVKALWNEVRVNGGSMEDSADAQEILEIDLTNPLDANWR